MARATINRLSDRRVKTAQAGMHPDGGGLYLRVTEGKQKDGIPALNRYWLFRYKQRGTRQDRQLGIGSLDTVTLAAARTAARQCRQQLLAGIDPKDQRDAQRASQAVAKARAMTFDECRDAYIASHQAGWRNAVHRQQWHATLRDHVTPIFGHLPVASVDTGLVLKVLESIWTVKPETASRVRGRIEAILDWARVRGYRDGQNPALWKGHLDHLLPRKSKVAKVKHQPALSYARVAEFMRDLNMRNGTAAMALRFMVLTAARAGEVFGMRWDEVDVTAKLWTIPPDRMKGGRQHRVPLSDPALAILREMMPGDNVRDIGKRYVFPGAKPGRPLSNMAMLELIRRINCERTIDGLPGWMDPEGRDVVPHGFRSTFKDWATDWSPSPAEIVEAAKRGEIVEAFPRDLVEVALAHALDSKTEEAYRRTEMIEKRRRLMSKWADYCARPVGASLSRDFHEIPGRPSATAGDIVPLHKEVTADVA
jgi:integrase